MKGYSMLKPAFMAETLSCFSLFVSCEDSHTLHSSMGIAHRAVTYIHYRISEDRRMILKLWQNFTSPTTNAKWFLT